MIIHFLKVLEYTFDAIIIYLKIRKKTMNSYNNKLLEYLQKDLDLAIKKQEVVNKEMKLYEVQILELKEVIAELKKIGDQ